MMNQGKYGYFDIENREYVITDPQTPTPWINYLGDGGYGGIVSNTGGGYSFDSDPRSKRVLRYRYNSIPEDQPGRYIYLRDDSSGKFWSASWQPVQAKYDTFQCRHGLGYTEISQTNQGIASQVLYFVPRGKKWEIWRLRLRNQSGGPRKISIFTYAEFSFFDAVKDQQNVDWVQQIGRGEFEENFIFWNAFMKTWDYTFMAANVTPDSFDTSRDSFIGRYRDLARPIAVENGCCSGSIAHRGNGVGSFCHQIELAPGTETELIYVLGVTPSKTAIRSEVEPLLNSQAVQELFRDLKRSWLKYLDSFQVETPDQDLNLMLNTWNPYQCKTTFNWSRFVSLYQLGVDRGMGLRDSAQDILGVLHTIPEQAQQLLIKLFQCQFEDGHAYHLFYPLTGEGSMGEAHGGKYNWYSDDHLWLIEATVAFLKETGSFELLKEPVTYAEKNREGTIWEHMMRSIDFTSRHLGEHGIPLNGFADWNDALNLDRGQGRAESVWTGMLFCRELGLMAELAAYLGKSADASEFGQLQNRIKDAINRHAWDGQWYLQAFDDDGMLVGSHTAPSEEQIYLNPQSWAVLSGVAPEERAQLALKRAEELLGTDLGLVLLYPAYKAFRSDRGGSTTYPPGAKENGGIFVHTNPWFIIAQMLIGENDAAYNNYRKILPVLKNNTPDLHQVEPYVYCQNILGKEHPQFGMGRNSWLTGTAAWAYLAGTQYLLGIRPQYDGLVVDPHLPKDWCQFTVWRRFRDIELEIRYTDPKRANACWYLDGEPLKKPGFIPAAKLRSAGHHLVEIK